MSTAVVRERSFVGTDVVVEGDGITSVKAFALALAYEMHRDPTVFVFGQDVAKNGGVFRYTEGLYATFPGRVFNTPLDEFSMGGVPIGMAIAGMKPVIEIQFMGFSLPALGPFADHAVRMRGRTRGYFTCPMVLTMPHGGEIGAPEFHGEAMETYFVHIPGGHRVVIPSSPTKTYGLLLAAIRDPDPVVFLNPVKTRGFKESVEDSGVVLPLDTCFVERTGHHVTLIAWGAMLRKCMNAAGILATQGISAEVIDVASLKPIDFDTILASVEKTGRAVVVHEAPRTCGVGAEILATILERANLPKFGTVTRVTGYDVPVISFGLEKYYIPNEQRIIDAATTLMAY